MTALYLLNPVQRACFEAMVKTSNAYSLLAAPELCRKLAAKFSSVYVLDVRPDSAWNHIATNPKWNAYGFLKGTKHIALTDLKNRLSDIPKNKEIVITDLTGNDAATAAQTLKQNGFEKVAILIEGMDRWISSDKNDWGCTKDLYESPVKYTILSPGEFSRFYPANQDAVLLDVRAEEEFKGIHKDAFRNIGHLKNAQNIPASDLDKQLAALESFKSKPIVIYSFSSGPEMYATANQLSQKGFSKVYVLAGGLFNLRWTASNLPGLAFMHDWVEAVPEENK
jgi:rhodanese-related sulfurtransferase